MRLFLNIFLLLSFVSLSTSFKPKASRAILFLIDSLAPEFLSNRPAFEFLQREGSWTYNARTVIQGAKEAAYAAILFGTDPIDTGVYFEETYIVNDGVPGAIKTLKRHTEDLRVAFAHSDEWLHYFLELNGQKPDEESFCQWNNDNNNNKCDEENTEKVVKIIESRDFGVILIQFGSLSKISTSIGSQDYLDGVGRINGYLERIFKSLAEQNLLNETLIGVTSDGSKASFPIPFMLMGPGVKKKNNLAALNLHGMDLMPTVFKGLGVRVPGFWRGRMITEAFEKDL